jgi:hypothetical protein
VCGVKSRKRLSFSLGVHANVPGRKFYDFIPCKAVCRKGPYDVGDVEACLRMSIGNVCPVRSEQGYAPVGPWSQ